MKYCNIKYALVVLVILFAASSCIKETSYEKGANTYGLSTGTLKDSLGNCKSIVIKGAYKKSAFLTDSNYILVSVNVTIPGQYIIYSDTINGFWFADSGYVSVGASTIKVQGYGKPTLAANTNFVLNYNNSACLFSVVVNDSLTSTLPVIRDYFPTTVGSNWGYDVVGLDSVHVKATAKDTIIDGNTYRVFYSSGSLNDTSFYRKSGADYFRWSALDNNSSPMSLLFLKENQPAATQWESNVVNTFLNGVPTQVKMHYTIMSVNTNRTVNAQVFDSVIYVKNELQYKVLSSFQTIQTIHTYFAKNIGLIELEAPGVIHQTLRRWKVY
ncbi:MAG: hypothetical protein KF781_03935 [Chitinophagaceae bacterium]|nr:hypothetical protein [Chitinophagaceae bacterium]MCW5904764.1 hypothetical protein [Chitinophagaceae bacterium]